MAVHQNHDYSHVPLREENVWEGPWEGPEARRNRALCGGAEHFFTLLDATHRLTARGVRRALTADHLRRRHETFGVLHPHWAFLVPWGMRVRKIVARGRMMWRRTRRECADGKG